MNVNNDGRMRQNRELNIMKLKSSRQHIKVSLDLASFCVVLSTFIACCIRSIICYSTEKKCTQPVRKQKLNIIKRYDNVEEIWVGLSAFVDA